MKQILESLQGVRPDADSVRPGNEGQWIILDRGITGFQNGNGHRWILCDPGSEGGASSSFEIVNSIRTMDNKVVHTRSYNDIVIALQSGNSQ
jgi:hypothetical protein